MAKEFKRSTTPTKTVEESSVDHIELRDIQDESRDSTRDEKLLVRRIDRQLLPWLCLLYALSLIDRTNISSAKVAGMAEDLNLVGNRYSVALVVFFGPYLISELPSNFIVRRVGTRYYLSFLIVSWGTIAMCMGFVTQYSQLVGLRLILGLFEGGFNPACIYLISSWYKRYETQQRLSLWYMSGSVISGFNGIISYGLSTLEGLGGRRGWNWIFIIPGAITVFLAIPIFLFLSDFPEKASWLSASDLHVVQERLREDRGEQLDDKITFRKALKDLRDWKVWVLASLLFFPTAGSYTMAFFTPSILAGLGYNVALSQILVTPPYLAAAIFAIAAGIISDRVHTRSPFIVGFMLLTCVGMIMIGWGNSTACKMVGIYFAVIGNNCAIPTVLAFLSNNIVGSSKRQIAVPLQTSMGAIGGVFGSLVFREQDYPGYRPGLYASIVCLVVCILITLFITAFFHRENQAADKKGKVLEGLEGYRYTL
ncbi:Major facilitator superfamily domain general substrate transporter [Penicillium concentricum]|uniref:Major facilitator superfamily domain general substrate transporter n=1 Tax=Penicillium concentricum TaxID=293559 RepID=A0A9X0B2B4_9EURO|nr:Major facilitator superfamily domain general substrate transporter [Penicillium concentricum]KAJ5385609.1 Major facilitator superfamily domain general substrate transporter [Penicillium concentricum]